MMRFKVYGKEYETRHNPMEACVELRTDNKVIGLVTRVAPRELALVGNRGFYRINGATYEALAKRHFQDTTGCLE